jgi:acyl-homoserine lactone acylase PvdQ
LICPAIYWERDLDLVQTGFACLGRVAADRGRGGRRLYLPCQPRAGRRTAGRGPARPRHRLARDPADVTHIKAQSPRDAWFALGYVHAQERGWQLEFNRRVMHGELSEVFGPATLETDKLLRTLGVVRAAERQWQTLPAEGRDAMQAYSDGINGFLRRLVAGAVRPSSISWASSPAAPPAWPGRRSTAWPGR